MNERCQKILVDDPDLYFSGLPIIIKQNDYASELFNGDIGIFLPTQENSDELSVWFAGNKGDYRRFSPARLPPFDLAFAMTIHRSQGSEYQDVMITLPLITSEILSRHLLYVACSRAKRMVRIHGSKEIFLETVRKSAKYSLGLENRLKEIN
jgi:exodeoxyribonuclease V alpha subunit